MLPSSVHLARSWDHLDLFYANAGILLIDGIDWIHGPLNLLSDPLLFFSDVSGTLKQSRGVLTKNGELGLVFSANVFGHFLMIRLLEPVMRRRLASEGPARIIFTGSHTAESRFFQWDDIQGIQR